MVKDLEDYISLSIVHWYKGDKDEKTGKYPGWHFATPEEEEGCIPDPLFGAKLLSEIYFKADKDYEGLYSVPVLWDIKVCEFATLLLRRLYKSLAAARRYSKY